MVGRRFLVPSIGVRVPTPELVELCGAAGMRTRAHNPRQSGSTPGAATKFGVEDTVVSAVQRYAVQQRRKREANRNAILNLLGGRCVRCAFDDRRALQIDHVSGGGRREQLIFGGGGYYARILEKVRAGSQDYQVLCANCNTIKKCERGEAPPRIHADVELPDRVLIGCGTHTSYRRGCRCGPCVEAHRLYSREGMRRTRISRSGVEQSGSSSGS